MQWEYKLADYGVSDDRKVIGIAESQMNGSGEQGWEAVAVWKEKDKIFVLYKRPWKTS
jgi:hypothetical protein